MECISCVANSDSGYVDVEFECYLTGDEGELTLDVKTNTYIRNLSIECVELNKKVINGTITSKSDIPSDMQVVATNNTTGLTYTSDKQLQRMARAVHIQLKYQQKMKLWNMRYH